MPLHLSPVLQTVFEMLKRQPCSAAELELKLWKGRGPKWARNDLRNQIWRLNKELLFHGLKVVCDHKGPDRNNVGKYRLVGVRSCVTLPHKQLDPWGISVE
jgi:hypothetical protein